MPTSCAASWGADGPWRRPALSASGPAWGRCGRVPGAARGRRRLSGTAQPQHGVAAAGAVVPVPCAQVSTAIPELGSSPHCAWGARCPARCRDPAVPCCCRAAASGGGQQQLQRAPGGAARGDVGPRVRQRHQPRHSCRCLPPAGLWHRGEAGGRPRTGLCPRLAGLGAMPGGGPLALALPLGALAPAVLRSRRGHPHRL